MESGPPVRDFVERAGTPELWEAFDACVGWLETFRSLHLEYAGRYIHSQAEQSPSNPTDVGTGGTPFMAYLSKHRDETGRQRTARTGG